MEVNKFILTLDIKSNRDLIIIHHYILQKIEREQNLYDTEYGCFRFTYSQASKDLSMDINKIRRALRKFENFNIIEIVYKAKSKTERTIYKYISK